MGLKFRSIRSKINQVAWQWRGVIMVTPLTVAIILGLRALGWMQLLELATYDQLLRLRSLEPQDQRVVIVGINETDIQKLGKYPVSDRVLAELINKIKQQKPRAIGLDVVRDLPVEPGHPELTKIFKTTSNLYGVRTINSGLAAIAPPPELEKLGQVSAAELIVDNDGTIRRAFLGTNLSDRKSIYGLGFTTALEYLNTEPNIPYIEAIKSPKFFKSNDGGYVKADDLGDQILLNYRRSELGMRTVSLHDVLENRVPKDLFRDRLVLIGITAVSVKDFFSTPLDRNLSQNFTQTAGVEIHGQIASQILAIAIDGRTEISTWDDPWEYLWIGVWTVSAGILVWNWRNFKTASQFWIFTITGMLGMGIAIALITYGAFVWGWWIPLIPTLLGIVGTTLTMTGFIYVDRLKASEHSYRVIADELRIAEANYRSIFENAVGGIFQMTPKGQFLSVNAAFAQMFGYDSPQDLISDLDETGESLYVSPNGLMELNLHFAQSDQVSGFEYQAYRSDRSVIWVRESVRIVRDGQDNILYYEGMSEDFTKAKLEEASLRQQLQELKVEIDEAKRQKQVAQITESDFFRDLQSEIASFDYDDEDLD